MNDKQKEVAARKLCELRGIDPDDMWGYYPEPDDHGNVYGILIHFSAWKLRMKEIEHYLMMEEAISAGLNYKDKQ